MSGVVLYLVVIFGNKIVNVDSTLFQGEFAQENCEMVGEIAKDRILHELELNSLVKTNYKVATMCITTR